MRWPHESAITRRDDQLARTRRLSLWVAGGATAATVTLAVALGSALPGHTITRGAPTTGTGAGTGGTASSGQSGEDSSGGGQVAPPTRAPSQPTAPPVVSSGGS